MSADAPRFFPPEGNSTAEAVKRLALALRALRMYPRSSPMLVSALDRAAEAAGQAAPNGQLRLSILPGTISWTSPDGEAHTSREAELARRLHLHGISHLDVAAGIGADDVAAFVESLLLDRDELEGPHPLVAGRVRGFAVESLDLERIFDDGDQAVESASVWDRVLEGFETGRAWSDLGRDAEQLASLLEWSMDAETQPEPLRGYSQTDVFGLICEQVALASEEDPEVTLDTIVNAVARLFSKIDREAWLEILSDPLPVTLGKGDRRIEIDLTSVISRALSAGQIEQVADYAVKSRKSATPRLYRFFQTALGHREDQGAIANRVLAANPQTQTESFQEAFPGFMEALAGEDASPYVNADYQASLDTALTEIPSTPPWPADVIQQRLWQLDESYTQLSMARVTHALLSRESSDEYYPHMMEALLARLDAVVDRDEPDLLEVITSTIVRHASDAGRSAPQRESAQAALDRLRQPEFIERVVRLMSRSDQSRFHALWRVVDHLGPACLPFVLDSMADNPSPAYRSHLARILQQLDALPVDLLRPRLADDRVGFVRDLVAVISEVGGEQSVPLLAVAAAHGDAVVRRNALLGFAQYPAAVSERFFVEALSDTALEVRVTALRGFRNIHADEAQGRLLAYLRQPNWTGRHTGVIAAAAKALARVGDVAALPALERLARKPWIFRRRRMPAALAAAAACAAIEQRLLDRAEQAPATPATDQVESQTQLAA